MKYYKTYNFVAVFLLIVFSIFVGVLFFWSEPQHAGAVQMPQQAVAKQTLNNDNGSSGANLVGVDDISDGVYSIDNDRDSFFTRDPLGELFPIEISADSSRSLTDPTSEMDLDTESGTRIIQSDSTDASAVAADGSGTGGAGSSGKAGSGSAAAGGASSSGTGGSGSPGTDGSGSSGTDGSGSTDTGTPNDFSDLYSKMLFGMKIENENASNGAFLVTTTRARFEYNNGKLKIYQGSGTDKRLLVTITFDQSVSFVKVESTNDKVVFSSDKVNISIYGDSTCLIGAKQNCNLTLKSNFEPAFRKISNERTVLSDILGGLCISPQLNGTGFVVEEKDKDLQLSLAEEQVMILRIFSTISDKSLLLSNTKNTQAVKEVLSGQRKTANAAWWGFDKDDSTSALQAAINSGAEKVVVPYMGTDWIVKPIKLASNQEVIFDHSVVVIAKKGEFKGERDCLFSGINITNVTLCGYGTTFRMQKKDYMTSSYSRSEWRHILGFYGCSNIKVLGLALESSGGDGISLGATKDGRLLPCRNVLIEDTICNDNYRQGISVCSVDKLRIENCLLSNTVGTRPQAGIDLEPDNSKDILNNVVISNCISKNNTGPGFQVYLKQLSKASKGVSILFVNCYVKSYGGDGLVVAAIKDDCPHGLIEFRNCTIEDVKYAGLYILDTSPNTVNLVFNNCKWRNVATSRVRAPIDIALKGKKNVSQAEGIEFINCDLYDENNRPFLKIRSTEDGADVYNIIKGDINVFNPYGVKIDSETNYKNPNLEIKSF